MELRNHISAVSHRKQGDWNENETIWCFKISEQLYTDLRAKLISEVNRLYNKYTGDGTAAWSCPAMGEYDEDFAWVFYGDIELPINLYEGENGGWLEVSLQNRPEDKLDRLDPQHPHWTAPHPTQWLEALSAIKTLTRH